MERIVRFYEALGAWAARLRDAFLRGWELTRTAAAWLQDQALRCWELCREWAAQPWALPLGIFLVLWWLGAWRAFKAEFGAGQWALKPERPRWLKALAYLAALPFRWLFALFNGFVEALVWGLLLLFIYMMWRVWHG